MKKLINRRPLVYVALAHISGIIFAAYSPFFGAWSFVLPALITCVVGGVFLFVAKGRRALVGFFFGLALLLALVGGVSLKLKADSVIRKSNLEVGSYTVVGVVDYASYSDGEYCVRLSDCTYDGEESGNLVLYGVVADVAKYDLVEATCYVKPSTVSKNGRYTSAILNSSSYTATSVSSIVKIGYKDCIGYRFKRFCSDKLSEIGVREGAVLTGLTSGDTVAMGGKIDSYRSAGIAHVFAVSGLHVGLLCVAIKLILGLITHNEMLKAVLTSCACFLYSLACGLTASSLRAAIICSTASMASASGEKRDSLTLVSLASIVVLLVNSADLLSAGFILSFSTYLSIIVLAPVIARATKIKSERLAGAFGVLAAAELVVVPLSTAYFGSFPVISLVSNFFFVPIVTVCYYLTFFGLILSTALPATVVLFPTKIVFVGVDFFIENLSRVGLVISVFPSWAMAIYYAALAICSDVFGLDKNVKVVAVVVALGLLAYCTFLSYAV